MKKTLLPWLIIILLLLGLAVWGMLRIGLIFLSNSNDTGNANEATVIINDSLKASAPIPSSSDEADNTNNIPQQVIHPDSTFTDVEGTTNELKSFEVTIADNSYEPSEITVNQGDTVRIIFTSQNGNHSWTNDDFSTSTEIAAPGNISIAEFIANQTGTFEFYSATEGSREQGLVGQLIVN